jgi:asparagine synthase (glutamine-hydrolysing)
VSGIVGLINLDREPIDPGLLSRMNNFMTFRGPDAQTIWSQGFVGFGHTMLRTTWESVAESQPHTLDERVWIVADARIDDRQTLIEKLDLTHRLADRERILTDVELILQAYLRWGDDFVQHLLGDFAFAIWDDRQQRLFCARDHFGFKPFYYSQVGNCLLFSNTLNCLRQHPQVSSKLNDRAIGDFLLFDLNYDLATTAFADIHRLPPAHTFTWSPARGIETRKYWTMPVPALIRFKNPQDYLDRFQELMGRAVGDRLRTDKVASFFSGGMDSTTIAATALAVAKERSVRLELKAFTTVSARSTLDRERYYAGLAADRLGIPIQYHSTDNDELYQDWYDPRFQNPEPTNNPLSKASWEKLQRMSAHSRVALCGHGGDEAFKPTTVMEMLQTMSILEIGADISRSYLNFGIQPHWGSGLLGWLRRWGQSDPNLSTYPHWLNPDFTRSLELDRRWVEIMNEPSKSIDSPRSRAYHASTSISWAAHLEANDPGVSGVPVEVRLPFLDLRLLSYLLALPPAPWCVDKMLLRTAMTDILPTAVRLRPKTPLAGDPFYSRLISIDSPQDRFRQAVSVLPTLPAIESYVNIDRLFDANNPVIILEDRAQLIPVSFAYWFDRHLDAVTNVARSTSIGRHDTS